MFPDPQCRGEPGRAPEHVSRPAGPSCWPVDEPSATRRGRRGSLQARESRWDELLRLRYNCELLADKRDRFRCSDVPDDGRKQLPAPLGPTRFWGNAVAIQIRLRQVELPNGLPANCANTNYNNNCRWYYTANPGFSPSPSVEPTDAQILDWPIQRSFMGSIDRTGPLRWLRLDIDPNCDTDQTGRLYGWDSATSADAASQPVGSSPCYVVNLGLQGGMARDQDEPPIGLLLGSGPSQRALVDCDPDVAHGQVADEIRDGCQWPPYRGNAFDDPPGPSGWCPYGDDTPGTFFDVPKPAPFDDWIQAFDCVLTRTTGSASQLTNGFDARLLQRHDESCLPHRRRIRVPAGAQLLAPREQLEPEARVRMGRHACSRAIRRPRHEVPRQRQAAREPVPHAIRLIYQHW